MSSFAFDFFVTFGILIALCCVILLLIHLLIKETTPGITQSEHKTALILNKYYVKKRGDNIFWDAGSWEFLADRVEQDNSGNLIAWIDNNHFKEILVTIGAGQWQYYKKIGTEKVYI